MEYSKLEYCKKKKKEWTATTYNKINKIHTFLEQKSRQKVHAMIL